jgi:hypothetical protein
MKIYLSPRLRIKEVKAAFNKEFPYLKLEFFRQKHLPGTANDLSQMVADNAYLIEATGIMREGEIEMKPHQTVSEIEQLFQSKFYLPVQVFRRGSNAWIETIQTDNYSLIRQNKMGREASNAIYDSEVLL